MFQLMMSPVCYFWKTAKTAVLKLFVSYFFLSTLCIIFLFVQWGRWEGMNKPDLYELISCS